MSSRCERLQMWGNLLRWPYDLVSELVGFEPDPDTYCCRGHVLATALEVLAWRMDDLGIHRFSDPVGGLTISQRQALEVALCGHYRGRALNALYGVGQ